MTPFIGTNFVPLSRDWILFAYFPPCGVTPAQRSLILSSEMLVCTPVKRASRSSHQQCGVARLPARHSGVRVTAGKFTCRLISALDCLSTRVPPAGALNRLSPQEPHRPGPIHLAHRAAGEARDAPPSRARHRCPRAATRNRFTRSPGLSTRRPRKIGSRRWLLRLTAVLEVSRLGFIFF